MTKEEFNKIDLVQDLNDLIKEDFCYLFVGHWLQGEFNEDRKNVGGMIKIFLETFKNKKVQPALILKTSGATSSIMDREDIIKKIDIIRRMVKGSLPNIYLLHGEVEDSDINILYNHPKVKAMINLTKGEGYGKPLLEFSLVGKPIIASGWSGHTDFLDPEFTLLVKGELKNVHPSAVVPNMILVESQWFTPDYSFAGLYIKDVYENYDKHLEKAKRQAYKSRTQFSFDKMCDKLDEIFKLKMPEIPRQVELLIPKLTKISVPKQIKINE